jgi:nucleotide-binding universal stress UspA family protein
MVRRHFGRTVEGEMAITARRQVRPQQAGDVFSRVLVAVDRTPSVLAAVRQGAILMERTGTLELLAAYDASAHRDGPMPVFLDADPDRERARQRLRTAELSLPAKITAATTTAVPGVLGAALLEELELGHETVLVAASGPTAAEALYEAPCSVLVARPARSCPPVTIVVGVDGSPESALAYAVGKRLRERFGAQLRPVVALGGRAPDAHAVERLVGRHPEYNPLAAGEALVDASAAADLLIVGNRGLHDASSLGSVAEKVAHDAHCSVLVVRSA